MKHIWKIVFVFCFSSIFGQESETQKWADYSLNYALNTKYNLKYNGAYKTTSWRGDWKSIENGLGVERKLGQKVVINFSALIAYNKQTDSLNSLELRPSLGFQYNLNSIGHLRPSFYIRFESRNVKDLEDDQWTQTQRLRFRPEVILPLNKKTFEQNDLWYALADAEWFVNLGEQEEFFANRFRIGVGIGYKLSDSWRFEIVYVGQLSKNTIDDEFNGYSNILRFRVKNYLKRISRNKSETVSGK